MEEFESIIEALKKVKRLSETIGLYDKIYLTYNDYYEHYFVTDCDYELTEKIQRLWNDSGCDNSPESEASNYNVWEYSSVETAEKYPNTFRNAKKSLIRSGVQLIRKKRTVECEYSVDFYVS